MIMDNPIVYTVIIHHTRGECKVDQYLSRQHFYFHISELTNTISAPPHLHAVAELRRGCIIPPKSKNRKVAQFLIFRKTFNLMSRSAASSRPRKITEMSNARSAILWALNICVFIYNVNMVHIASLEKQDQGKAR